MQCPQCGEELDDNKQCAKCGDKRAEQEYLVCPICGENSRKSSIYCDNCHWLLMPETCPVCGCVYPLEDVFCRNCGASFYAAVPPHLSFFSAQELLTGTYVTFGHYNMDFGPDPIEWQVLENGGKTALLISKYGLDCQPFRDDFLKSSWRDCYLREWLNGTFFEKAFNSAEQAQIALSRIYTGDNAEYGVKGCGETRDKVFCLSIEEAKQYFRCDADRACKPTYYAVNNEAYIEDHEECIGYGFGNCYYWLRSPGGHDDFAAFVDIDGEIMSYGIYGDDYDVTVRPALRVKLP